MNKQDKQDIKAIIETIEFDNDISIDNEIINHFNIKSMEALIENDEDETNFSALKQWLENFKKREATVSKGDIKKVFVMLKDRKIHPIGTFDKAGRFYLEDAELVDVRTPSAQYPYSQMTAGRTAKFVKAIAEKYKCANFEELLAQFN